MKSEEIREREIGEGQFGLRGGMRISSYDSPTTKVERVFGISVFDTFG